MLVVKYIDPSIIRSLCVLMTGVITGKYTVTFEGNDPAGPARFAKIRSGRNVNAPIIALIDGILWNEQLVPIMNQLAGSRLPYLEMLGNMVSLVSLLE